MSAPRLLLLAAAVCFFVTQPPTFAAGDAFLIDQFGQPVDARDLSGHWLLVYFGYSQCSTECPTALMRLSATLTRLGPRADSVLPLFVSLDAIHDSPEVLRAFTAHFSPRLRALTGSADAVAQAARTFGVHWHQQSGSPTIDHSLFIYLVAPGGQVVQALHPEQPVPEMADLIEARFSGRQ